MASDNSHCKSSDVYMPLFYKYGFTTGQNAVNQAQLFSESTPITGIILTKLDGSAKGGIVLAISHEHKIPVKLVGVGEGVDDLQDFDAESFSKAMIGGDEPQEE